MKKLIVGKVYRTSLSFKLSKNFSTQIKSFSNDLDLIIFLGYEENGYWLKCLKEDKIVYFASFPRIEFYFIPNP